MAISGELAQCGRTELPGRTLRQVLMPDHQQFLSRDQEILRAKLRSGHILPGIQRELVDEIADFVPPPVIDLNEASDELHIENPARQERTLEHIRKFGRGTEELRTALRVVNGETENERRAGGENATQVMTNGSPLDVTPEKFDTRTEDDVDERVGREDAEQVLDRVKWSRQIGIPKSDDRDLRIRKRAKHSGTHRFGLAGVYSIRKEIDLFRKLALQQPKAIEGAVGAPVVNEDDVYARRAAKVFPKRTGIEPDSLVIAGNDDGADFHIGCPPFYARDQ